MELEDSFIENWKYIIKSHKKQTKIKINTLLGKKARVLQWVQEMLEQI